MTAIKKYSKVITIFSVILMVGIFIFSQLFFIKDFTNNNKVLGTTEDIFIDNPILVSGDNETIRSTYILNENVLENKNSMSVSLNTNGLCLNENSRLFINLIKSSSEIYPVNLKYYINNCDRGEQRILIPIADFGADLSVDSIIAWELLIKDESEFNISINKVSAFQNVLGSKKAKQNANLEKGKKIGFDKAPISTPTPIVSPTLAPTLLPTPVPTTTLEPTINPTITPSPEIALSNWTIKSVSSMKETKDRICSPRSEEFVRNWVSAAKQLGVNYISISTPYDNPQCGNSLAHTKLWVDIIRENGLKVWHRHMPLSFEGIYNTPKNNNTDYLNLITNYIKENPHLFAEGDIFTPIPEPQNGGINGVNYCSQGVCIFDNSAVFNNFLINAMDSSQLAFNEIGINNINIGYWGFDGFIAWGDNNPDWNGILDIETVIKMGNITIDHYPEIVGDTMENDLNELHQRYPNVPVVIGEWGTISGVNDPVDEVNNSMGAASQEFVDGFNYWHMGMGGNEALINELFEPLPHYFAVQMHFLGN